MGRSRQPAVGHVRVNVSGRRTFTAEYKRTVAQECLAAGVSVAGIALKHGINANLLRTWLRKQQLKPSSARLRQPAALLPVVVNRTESGLTQAAPTASWSSGASCIEIELDGARIRLRGEVDIVALRAVLHALGTR